MKIRLIYVLSAVLFLVSILIPSWLWFRDYFININQRIDSSILSDYASFQIFIISFWALGLNLILVLIAYKAFQNFDIKKQFHNKQLEIVSELSISITETEISSMFYHTVEDPSGKVQRIATGYEFSFFETALGFKFDEIEQICLRSNNIENVLPFLKFRNHPILPKNISSQLNKLYQPLMYLKPIKEDDFPKNYIVFSSVLISKDDYSKDWIFNYYKNPIEFTKDCKKLREEIVSWYKLFGAKDLNI